jgi:outer membrane receptor protein involved in Fe transport
MGKNRIVQHAVRAALAAAAASAAVPMAWAQTTPPQTAQNVPNTQAVPTGQSDLAEVVVTGSRIQSANLISISPVTTVTATEIAQTGATRIEDVLNNLPQIYAGETSSISNGADGTASVDLHDLGPQRTLVLVNGRRLAPGAPDGRNYADLDQIPVELVERVEVLTGGASSTYGADAVSGVVNFIMNTHYEGVKLDAGYSLYQHNNHESLYSGIESAAGDATPPSNVDTGFNKNLAFTAGSNFDEGKGNATVYATYANQAPVLEGKFDYSACTLAYGGPGSKPVCGGSGTNAGGNFSVYNSSGSRVLHNTVDPKTGVFRPSTAADDFNYGPINYYTRPSEKYTAGAFLNYDVAEHTNVYAEISYLRNNTVAQLAPDGDFEDNGPLPTGAISLNCGPVGVGLPGNPLLTAQERSVLCAPSLLASQGQPPGGVLTYYLLRRNVEGGGRTTEFNNDDWRTVIGVKGDIIDGLKYDAYGQVGITDQTTSYGNVLSTAGLGNALDVVEGPNGPACAAALTGVAPTCVPWNIFVPHGVTPQALAYLTIPLTTQGTVKEYVGSANLTADLSKYGVQLPTAKNGLIVNAGTEYREEQSQFLPDYALQDNLSSYGITLPLAGGFHVAEAFTEFNLPIADDLPGADQLAVNGGYRYSSYTLGFNTNTYKFGVEWAPVKDVRFRGSFTQAARAPNIAELYTSATVSPGGTTDPCWGPTPALTQAQCERTGVPANLYGKLAVNPANQFNTSIGGNPALTAEIAHTWSYGLVFQPQFLPSFSASVDYYDIRITGAIQSQSGTSVIFGCALGISSTDCADIHRGPTGSLWANNTDYVSTLEANTGLREAKGVDVTLHYGLNLAEFGKLAFNMIGTAALNNITQPAVTVVNAAGTGFVAGPSYDCAGYNGNTCGNPLPRWRSTFSADWLTPWSGLDFNARWRYIGPTLVDSLSQASLLGDVNSIFPSYSRVPSYSYLDLSASAQVVSNVTVRVGVNNVLDKDPPIVLSGDCPAGPCNGNTWAGTYDVLGRYLYARASVKF